MSTKTQITETELNAIDCAREKRRRIELVQAMANELGCGPMIDDDRTADYLFDTVKEIADQHGVDADVLMQAIDK